MIDVTLVLPLAEVEKNHILRTLSDLKGNKERAAKILKIGRATLYRKLHKYGYFEEPKRAVAVG